eukprot:366406-Chlamydomonas_euryale.AAC.37
MRVEARIAVAGQWTGFRPLHHGRHPQEPGCVHSSAVYACTRLICAGLLACCVLPTASTRPHAQACHHRYSRTRPTSATEPCPALPPFFERTAASLGPATCPDSTWRDEFWALALLAAPTVVQSGSQQAMLVVDQVFLGHLGTSALAAASLGITYSNIMW